MSLGAAKALVDKRNSQVISGASPTPEMGGNIPMSIYTSLSIKGLPGHKVLILCLLCCAGMSPEADDTSVSKVLIGMRIPSSISRSHTKITNK